MKEVIPVPGLLANEVRFGYSQCVTFNRLVFVSGQALPGYGAGIDNRGLP
jgi:hypothetical protein